MKKLIKVSATDVFEYVKCPAFFKQAMFSGKKPDECYHDYYRELIFKKGIDFEKSQIEKLTFVETEESLKELIDNKDISMIRIDPRTILYRQMDEIFDLPNDIDVICTGKPDLLIRDPDSMEIVPLEYKTSTRYFESILCQLKHYCFLLQKYQPMKRNIGYLKTPRLGEVRVDLDAVLRDYWERVLYKIVQIKLTVLNQQKECYNISKSDLNWNKECKYCYFHQSCKNLILKNVELKYLPQIKNRRFEMLRKLKIDTFEKLASFNPNELWEKILKLPDGKIVFQRKWTIDYIISKARAFLEGECIPLKWGMKKLEFNVGDAFFDLEYMPDKEAPIIFSISLGIINDKKELDLKNWFADEPNLSSFIVNKFYEFLKKNQINVLSGWSIKSADIPQLKKVSKLPKNIKFVDVYQHLIKNFAFPTIYDGLKYITEYLFDYDFTTNLNIRNGLQAISLYQQFLESKNLEFKNAIIKYNNLDVIQTFNIVKWINEFTENQY
ncbi:MAG: TM0106 family RecB-like putative nuclease [Promethearchaeota archaeon]